MIFATASAGVAATLDDSFHPQVNGAVSALAAQPDGKILVGGLFTSVNGVPRSSLARLFSDGSLDDSFAPTNAPSQFVRRIVVRDAKIYAVGDDGLRRFDTNGVVDWHYPVSVLAFDVDLQQRVIFGGQFTRIENQFHRNIARLDPNGILDSAFGPVIGCCAGEGVNAILALGDRLLIGGSFQSVNGESAAHLARINPDGSRDGTFNGTADSPVFALIPGGCGTFFRASRQAFAHHLADGAVDSGFTTLFANSSEDSFVAGAVQADGKPVVGGSFTFSGDATRRYIVRLNTNGSIDSSFAIQPNDAVQAIAAGADGSVLMGGAFTAVNGAPVAGIARITAGASAGPALKIAAAGRNIVVSWNALSGVVLEFCVLNGAEWAPVQQAGVNIDGRTHVTNSVAGAGQLFRLRLR